MKKKKNLNKVKTYSGVNTKHPNSPSDRISKTFRNHSNKYKTIMGQTWGDKK
tara:strand:- start:185 stop:340 length:156 start_codon:yes stop_codon:yes gene_type:complete